MEDFRFITKIQKIDTTRSHGIEIKDSLILLGELRLFNEKRFGELLKQMDLKVTARDEKGVIQGNSEVPGYTTNRDKIVHARFTATVGMG